MNFVCVSVIVYVSVISVFSNFYKIDFSTRLNFVFISVCVSISVLDFINVCMFLVFVKKCLKRA